MHVGKSNELITASNIEMILLNQKRGREVDVCVHRCCKKKFFFVLFNTESTDHE